MNPILIDETEMVPFLIWWWENEKTSFIIDILDNMNEKNIYKYFCANINDFKKSSFLDFQKMIENEEFDRTFEGFVCLSGGIESFITAVLLDKNRGLFRRIKNIRYRFATTEDGTIITRKQNQN